MRNDQNNQNIVLTYQGAAGTEGNTIVRLDTTGCAYSGGCVAK